MNMSERPGKQGLLVSTAAPATAENTPGACTVIVNEAEIVRSSPTHSTPSVAVQNVRLAYHFVVAVDIEGFSRLSVLDQIVAQADLELTLKAAAKHAALDRGAWHRQPAGDGELAVLPSETDGLRLVADFPGALAVALAEVNSRRRPTSRLRIRVAMHHGTLVDGLFGPAGQAPIVVARLLDSDALREVLSANHDIDLALAVSASLFAEVVETRLGGLNPAEFQPTKIIAKGSEYVAYMNGQVSS